MKKNLGIILFLCFAFSALSAQELSCNLQVNATQIQTGDKKVFETLQKALYEFVNGRKWTNLNIGQQERIECGMTISIQERDINTGIMKATLSVQARRPVHNTSYSTSILNINDKDFTFKYMEFDPIEFSDNSVSSNLTATIGFYSYMILGIYFDTFSRAAGAVFFERAQNIVTLAQSLNEGAGWTAVEKNQMNRYWQVESFTNGAYEMIHDVLYQYHRDGLDNMYAEQELARQNIIESFSKLKALNTIRLGLACKQIFIDSKSEEVINVFSPVGNEEKQKILAVLKDVDPSNMPKYQRIVVRQNISR